MSQTRAMHNPKSPAKEFFEPRNTPNTRTPIFRWVRKVRGTLDLTPALSSEERENRTQRAVKNQVFDRTRV
jgi:hypothetical protein